MSFSGGVYTLPGPALVTGEVVSATENNQFRNDVAGAFNVTMLRNGTSTATANLPMGGYKLTGLGAATTSGDALSYGQAAVVTSLTSTALTATRVPYAGTGGLLQDASTFTFDGTTLTAGGFSTSGNISAATATVSGNITVSGGTANGVAYLNGSKVLTTGSALTYNGTRLTIGGVSAGTIALYIPAGDITGDVPSGSFAVGNYGDSASELRLSTRGFTSFRTGATDGTSGSEQMRLTSTGLGIGTSSPANKLDVVGGAGRILVKSTNTASNADIRYTATNADWVVGVNSVSGTGEFTWYNVSAATERMRLDSSGNLGLGVTPSAWQAAFGKAIQLGIGAALVGDSGASRLRLLANAYFDGSNWLRISSGYANQVYQNGTDGSVNWYLAGTGAAGSAITFTQAMTLDASGNLGLGTTTLQNDSGYHTLSLSGSTGGQIAFQTGGTTKQTLSHTGTDFYCWNIVSGAQIFGTNNAERMRIDSSGNLLVGTTATQGERIRVVASSNSTYALMARNDSSGDVGSGAVYIGKYDNNSTTSQVFVRFAINYSGTASGQINANGASQAAFGSWSDVRLKENIETLSPQLANICSLRPVEFDYIESEGGGHQIGFIAQEMQEVYPDAVGERQPDGMLTVTGWSKTEARLVKAIQELKAELDATKAEVAALKAK